MNLLYFIFNMVKIIFKGKTSENGGDTVFQIAKRKDARGLL